MMTLQCSLGFALSDDYKQHSPKKTQPLGLRWWNWCRYIFEPPAPVLMGSNFKERASLLPSAQA